MKKKSWLSFLRTAVVFVVFSLTVSLLFSGCSKKPKEPSGQDGEQSGTTPEVTAAPSPEATVTTTPASPTPMQKPQLVSGSIKPEEYPVVDGSTATLPLSQALYRFATGAGEEEAQNTIVHTKTTNSYYRLMKGEADLLLVYEPSEEVRKEMETVSLRMEPVGRDALVFMANAANPVKSMTEEEIIGVYSGKITNWSELGGENKAIQAFQRPVNSGSQTLMQKLVMKDVPMTDGDNIVRFEGMADILEGMLEYTAEADTLGYSVYYYAGTMYKIPDLKFMAVDGVLPSRDTIYNHTYPYTNDFYVVIREDEPEDSNASKLFEWMIGTEGQKLVEELGYVPVRLPEDENNTWKEEDPSEIPPGSLDHTGNNGKGLLKQGQYYLTYLPYAEEMEKVYGTLLVYDSDFQLVDRRQNCYVSNSQIGICESGEEVILTELKKEGDEYRSVSSLYRPDTQTTSMIPGYTALYSYKPFEEYDYYYANQSQDSVHWDLVRRDGTVLIPQVFLVEYAMVREVGDYFWYNEPGTLKGEMEHIWIYDKEFQLVTEFPIIDILKDYGISRKEDGSGKFTVERFLELAGIEDATPEEVEILNGIYGSPVIHREGNSILQCKDMVYIVNMEEEILLKYPLEEYQKMEGFSADIECYSYQVDGVRQFYTYDGELLTTRKGTPFIGYDGRYTPQGNETIFFYAEEDGKAVAVEYPRGRALTPADRSKEEMIFPLSGQLQSISREGEGYYIVNEKLGGEDGTGVSTLFYGDQLLEKDDSISLYYYQGDKTTSLFWLSYQPSGSTFSLYSSGELLYRSPAGEDIRQLGGGLMQILRGNYLLVTDYRGDEILRLFCPQEE